MTAAARQSSSGKAAKAEGSVVTMSSHRKSSGPISIAHQARPMCRTSSDARHNQSRLADHGGGCPRDLGELVPGGYTRDLPLDAWGRPLRLECAGARGAAVASPTDALGFRVSSDGPDGVPGGLDRVE